MLIIVFNVLLIVMAISWLFLWLGQFYSSDRKITLQDVNHSLVYKSDKELVTMWQNGKLTKASLEKMMLFKIQNRIP